MKTRVAALVVAFGAAVLACSSADANGTPTDGANKPASSRKHGSSTPPSDNGGSSDTTTSAPEGDPTTPTSPTPPAPSSSSKADGGAGDGGTTATTTPKLQCSAIPTCANALAMKSISGDGTEQTSTTGAGSQWLTIHIREDSLSSKPIGFSAELYAPEGATYEMYMYEKDCTTPLGTVDTLTDGAEGTASWDDTSFLDDAKDVVIEIRHVDGVCTATDKWTLDILGGTF